MYKCFLIAPIGARSSTARARTDGFESKILRPALQGLKYQIERADRIPEPGIITNQIVRLLATSELVIADLTDHNANVFYEMGIRHALKKSIVHVKLEGTPIPFDNVHMRAVDYSFGSGIRNSVASLRHAVLAATTAGVENPFSASTESYLVLRTQFDPKQFRSLDVLDGLDAIAGHFKLLFSNAGSSTEFWGQTVGGTGFPSRELLEIAVARGASLSFIITQNPPHSTHILHLLAEIRAPRQLRYVVASASTVRFFGMGTSHLLLAMRIDGRYNAVIINDYDLIRYFRDYFDRRFANLRRGASKRRA